MKSHLLALALVSAACSEKAPAPVAAPVASPTVKGLAALTGEWVVKLSEQQQKELRNMNLVFDAAEPSPELLATLGPQERTTITAMRAARLKSPDDPQFLQMREVILGMANSRLRIGTSSLTLTIGQVRQDAPFTVLTETSTAVTIRAALPKGRSESMVLLIDGPDAIRMAKPGQNDALGFTRSKP